MTTHHPLSTLASRQVWLNSILEAFVLSEDHVDYIQQLIFYALTPGSPFLHTPTTTTTSSSSSSTTTTLSQTTKPKEIVNYDFDLNQSNNYTYIIELLVLLSKGDYVKIYLHPAMYPILTLLNEQLQLLIQIVKQDQSKGLTLNLINTFATTLFQWLQQQQLHNDDNNNCHPIHINQPSHISKYEESQFLLIILSIASIQLFSQVNYAGLPIVLPVTQRQYMDNNTKIFSLKHQDVSTLDQIDEDKEEIDEEGEYGNEEPESSDNNDSNNNNNAISLQTRINLFFSLFSPKDITDSKQVIELVHKASKHRFIHVEKTILTHSSLKLNGEDTYQCSHYPLFLIIARSILNCEGLLRTTFESILPILSTTTSTSLTSVFTLLTQQHVNDKLINNNNTNGHHNYFELPAILHFSLRSVKLHIEVLLSTTSTIRTEFYTLSLLYQSIYGILSAPSENNNNNTQKNQNGEKQDCCQLTNQHETICSEFTCISFKPFHKIYHTTNNTHLISNSTTLTQLLTNRFFTIYNAIDNLILISKEIKYIDQLSGVDLGSVKHTITNNTNNTNNTSTIKSTPSFTPSNTDNSYFDIVLLVTYNHFTRSNNPTTLPQQDKNGKNTNIMSSAVDTTVDDIHAVGISPLTYHHTHASYFPITLFPTIPFTQSISELTTTSSSSSTPNSKPLTTIPITLSTTLFSTITIELSQIALKLYLYKRSFLLLSLSKIFSGICIYVSGILGRRTRYQSRSFAQLHGISFLHRDVIRYLEFDSNNISKPITIFNNKDDINNNHTNNTNSQWQLEYPIKSLYNDEKYIISMDITETSAAPYIIQTDDTSKLLPKIQAEQNDKFLAEKERYKGVINERNPTIPRVSKLTHHIIYGCEIEQDVAQNDGDSNDNDDVPPLEIVDDDTYAICVTRGGHVEDVPIDTVDDLYLTYMLPDTDNYNVKDGTNLKDGHALDDLIDGYGDGVNLPKPNDQNNVIVKSTDNLYGVVELLATSKNGVIFEPTKDDSNDINNNTQSKLKQVEPPVELFDAYKQTSLGSVLALNVANYLYQTCPQSEITQQEQDCYLQTIFMHQYSQSNQYLDQDKNSFGSNYQSYSSLFSFNSYSVPYATILYSLLLRSVLEFTNPRLQIRAISQVESISNLYITAEDKLSRIHFQPQYLPEVMQLYHNIGIDNTKYNIDLQQVTKTESTLTYLYDNINLPHHQYQQQYPIEYASLITKTIRNLINFRLNKIFTSFMVPWWDILRTCADICTKSGYISTSLRCFVNVQLWSSVIDTLIKIGRRGDATKLLKHVLKIKDKSSETLLEEWKIEQKKKQELDAIETQHELLTNQSNIDNLPPSARQGTIIKTRIHNDGISSSDFDERKQQSDISDISDIEGSIAIQQTPVIPKLLKPIQFIKSDDDFDSTTKSTVTTTNSTPTTPSSEDENNDSDYREGSLLYFVAKAMESTLFTTTTSDGIQTHSASSYRLYHLLGESTQDQYYWELSWELSGQTYAPPQRALGKYHAVRKNNEIAYKCYQNALALNGSDHQTWYECGVVAIRLSLYEKAIPCFSNALRLKPDVSEGWNNLAACHIYLGNVSSAYHALAQCLRSRTSSWKIWENFLQCSLQLEFYNDVLTSLSQISELKGKIDPQTLLPIQYTTKQSKFHVYALYTTWMSYLSSQTRTQIENYVITNDELKANIQNQITVTQKPNLDEKCLLCITIPRDPVLEHMSSIHMNIWTHFPIVKNFQTTIQGVMTNISHNESREHEMGGMMRGGGDDAGSGNSIAASMDFNQQMRQDDDENAENIVGDNDDDGDDINNNDNQHGKFLQSLSLTAKGQRCILNYLLALSNQLIAIQDEISLLKQSSIEFETCINILIKMLIETTYHQQYNSHIDFIITCIQNIINNSISIDDHVLRHNRDYTTNPITSDDRSRANNKETTLLLCSRVIDGLNRDYNNNKANLTHLLPYISKLSTIQSTLKNLCHEDDLFFTTQLATNSTSGNNDTFVYDPYDSFY